MEESESREEGLERSETMHAKEFNNLDTTEDVLEDAIEQEGTESQPEDLLDRSETVLAKEDATNEESDSEE